MMPTHFRWVWYLVGLAGMALTIVGVVAILGSAADLGILVPVVLVGAVAIWYGIRRFRRSLDEAVAAAPSRQSTAVPAPPEADPAPAEADPAPAGGVAEADVTDAGSPSPEPAPKKRPDGPPRTSRR